MICLVASTQNELPARGSDRGSSNSTANSLQLHRRPNGALEDCGEWGVCLRAHGHRARECLCAKCTECMVHFEMQTYKYSRGKCEERQRDCTVSYCERSGKCFLFQMRRTWCRSYLFDNFIVQPLFASVALIQCEQFQIM